MGSLSSADKLVQFLSRAGLTLWQIASANAVAPPNFHPKLSTSAFAGNIYLIDTDVLAKFDLVTETELSAAKHAKGSDFEYAAANKDALFRRVCFNFFRENPPRDYLSFTADNAYWLDDYALFTALSARFDNLPFWQWEKGIAVRNADAVARYSDLLTDQIDNIKLLQYLFFTQFQQLKHKLEAHNITFVGSLNTQICQNSADVWANRSIFYTNNGMATTNDPIFWQKRLETASKLYHAVYIAGGAPSAVNSPIPIFTDGYCQRTYNDVYSPLETKWANIARLFSSGHDVAMLDIFDFTLNTATLTKETHRFMMAEGDLSYANAKLILELTKDTNRAV
jgi:hypothetical protein